jgi:hypothetical protein
MSIKLDELNLSNVKGQVSLGLRSETSSVKRIGTIDKRRIVKHEIPSLYGTIVTDEGKESARLVIVGQFVGEDAMNGMSSLRKKYKKGEPVNLISDLTTLSNINKVLIEDLRIQMKSSMQLSYEYEMILREYVEPKKASASAPSQKAQALKEVGSEAAGALQELNQGAAAAVQQAGGLGQEGPKALGGLQELEQETSAAIQEAQALKEVGMEAVGALRGLDEGNTTPSQKAQALAEVGSHAAKVFKDLEE